MKNKFNFLVIVTLLTTVNAFAGAIDCFEREWIVTSKSAQFSTDQLIPYVQAQMPFLKVGEKVGSSLIVSYQAASNATLAEDKQKLKATFNQLQAAGFVIECNGTVDPLPSMTGTN